MTIQKYTEIIRNELNNYINNLDKKLSPADKLLKLNDFIIHKNYELTNEDYIYLIQHNPSLANTLENTIAELTLTSSPSFVTTTLNQHSEIFIDTYCLINDISLDKDAIVTKEELPNTLDNSIIEDPYLLYISQITRPLLTKEQEKELFTKLTTATFEKQKEIKKEIIESNLLLVARIAKFYHQPNNEHSILDLIQEGNIGLMHAIDKFDISKDYKFSTYASFWIRESISRYLINQKSLIRVPEHAYHENKRQKQNNSNNSTNITLKYPEPQVISTHNHDYKSLSNDSDNHPLSYYDVIPTPGPSVEDLVIEHVMQQEVRNFINRCNISPECVEILQSRYGLNNTPIQTLAQIGVRLMMTRQGVNIRENKLLDELRKNNDINSFADYMDNPHQALQYIKEKKKKNRGRPRKS